MAYIDSDKMAHGNCKVRFSLLKSEVDLLALTEDVAPVVRGNWIFETIGHHDVMTCSNCQTVHEHQDGTFDYCPYCGAYMVVDDCGVRMDVHNSVENVESEG